MGKRHYWWLAFGNFSPVDEREQRPDPLEVLLFFLDRTGVTPEKRASKLIQLLGIKKDVAYAILKGEWFDSIARCRLLVEALSLPAQLLAIDGQYRDKQGWWKEQGYPFDAGPDGYPDVGQAIAYFRSYMFKTVKGVQRPWTQEDLALALQVSKVTVNHMEHNHTHAASDKISRREAIGRVIQTAAKGTNLALVFPLLGLDARSFAPPDTAGSQPLLLLPGASLNDMNFQEHKQMLDAFHEEYMRGHGQGVLEEAAIWYRMITHQIAPLARNDQQRINIVTLQSLYHRFVTNIGRELRQDQSSLFHANKAVAFAQDGVRLAQGSSEITRIRAQELEYQAIRNRAVVHFEQGTLQPAQEDVDTSLSLCRGLPASQLTAQTLIDAGLIHAYAAQSEQERRRSEE